MKHEEWVDGELAELKREGLLRECAAYSDCGPIVRADGRACLNLSSNDYLGLTKDARLARAAARALGAFGSGATASRLVVGTLDCHVELEGRLAVLKGYPAALLFGSGYLANIGTLAAIAGRGDRVFADRLCHASIVDGITASRARRTRFNHNDPQHLRTLMAKCPAAGRKVVVTESVFSMDGDVAPLGEIASVCAEQSAMLMVDEAHATGVFGDGGAGRVRELGLESEVNISMGTLSKALGGYGGFVACSRRMRDLLLNRARSFVYSTALPPCMAGVALAALDVLKTSPEMGAALRQRASAFRANLQAAGLNTGGSMSQIVPVIVGDAGKAMAFSARLRREGILGVAIRPPTVPAGSARIRFSVTLAHSREQLAEAADTIVRCARQEGLL
jgi:8-amino-7-oxononanoate synthase